MTTVPITLTTDQQNAMDAFNLFLLDPIETVFVLQGYSGTGKTTLIKTLLERIPGYLTVAKLVSPTLPDYQIELTATTNKAAENFAYLTGNPVSTIHSFLGLRVESDYASNTSRLVSASDKMKDGYLLFIDEASYIDSTLLEWIFKRTVRCKIVFIGDPAQLTPVKSTGTPVFDANFSGAMLSQVVRQAEGHPIINLSTKFRETVTTGQFFQFKPDGKHITYMDRSDFEDSILAEFSRTDWRHQDSKVLAWTNKTVIGYNHAIQDAIKGNPKFQVGDYAMCNKYVSSGRKSINTDQLVCITGISAPTQEHGVVGHHMTIDYVQVFFFPDSLQEKNALIKSARAAGELHIVEQVDNRWIDLRAAYACTINKAQGSTYDRVFIDLDDVRRCNSGDQIARMLYVGVSRARQQVFLTGDLV